MNDKLTQRAPQNTAFASAEGRTTINVRDKHYNLHSLFAQANGNQQKCYCNARRSSRMTCRHRKIRQADTACIE